MKPDATVVIVGAGQGGVQVAASLRERGHAGPVVLVGDEPGLPYQRPPLSKRFLLHPQTPIELRPQSFYERRHIELRHTRVTSIDRSARRVRLADGDTLAYDHVVLAMGARNRIPPIDGITLNGNVQVRTQDDAERLRTRLQAASHLAIIGAGFIGMEVAAAAAKTGIATTVIEALHRPMARAVSVATSTHMADLHRAQGTTLRLGRTVVRLDGDRPGAVTGVRLDDGSLVPADLVVVGVGVTPAVELATEAGIDVGDGIRVDAFLRTSDPHISAIGDCAEFPSVHTGARTRLESVQNAVDQARCLAACLTGAPTPYNAVPWFWTEQFSTKLQIAGLGQGQDESTTLGDPATGSFSVLLFKDGLLAGVESVNAPADHTAARRILAFGKSPRREETAADGFSLRQWADRHCRNQDRTAAPHDSADARVGLTADIR
ncbi:MULTISPECIES: NAD(P)/FAD-dependent oxidoreductase [Streptomyces]|uniref:NAD(P)/FAD-dependent oxidoreductase n=1 Tax=Streptomyces TaxID=1883 RepID=UPI001A9425CB|nr:MULTISPECIES: FAD-dependent oxidoreductase [Streptomyces]MBO0914025.1 FAD-dependent oxidoreductase [Streptomyces laculatispora]MCX4768145.1 FAD-dependent oxidoreductase [Streptomyces sp. NBC_01285]